MKSSSPVDHYTNANTSGSIIIFTPSSRPLLSSQQITHGGCDDEKNVSQGQVQRAIFRLRMTLVCHKFSVKLSRGSMWRSFLPIPLQHHRDEGPWLPLLVTLPGTAVSTVHSWHSDIMHMTTTPITGHHRFHYLPSSHLHCLTISSSSIFIAAPDTHPPIPISHSYLLQRSDTIIFGPLNT